ncbi:MAG: hypothetical protein JXA62_00080 [Candidatus Aminicenantes bacterium]|nr:hypothetical protein [Candidatus Aminicenantes bacterium]
MRFRIRVKAIWMLCLFGFLGVSILGLAAQDKGDPVSSPRVTGTVTYEVRPHVTRARLFASVWKNSSFVSGLNVKLVNTPALIDGNAYKCVIEPFSAQPGSPVTVSFLSQTTPVKKPLVATVIIEKPPIIRSPALDSQIDLDSSQHLVISWSGGTPPYHISVIEYVGDTTPSSLVFQQSGITSTQVSVPVTQFNPAKKYGVVLSGNPVNFRFDGPTDPGTNFRLVPSVGTHFYTKQRR